MGGFAGAYAVISLFLGRQSFGREWVAVWISAGVVAGLSTIGAGSLVFVGGLAVHDFVGDGSVGWSWRDLVALPFFWLVAVFASSGVALIEGVVAAVLSMPLGRRLLRPALEADGKGN